jgi:hypothetical protein
LLLAGWVVREAYKLIVVPVADNIRQRFVDEVSVKIADPVANKLFHKSAPPSGAVTADIDFVDTIEKAPEAGAVLSAEMGQMLGVELSTEEDLSAVEVRKGTPGWYVSAYAAILWRIAMLAVWEDRPIAIQGALQGWGWVTVCVPRVHAAINPSTMWRQSNPHTLLRVLHNKGPADFFVRQVKNKTVRGRTIAELNEQFMRDPDAAFKPAKTQSIADDWHRIDGLSRKWVLLKPDANAEQVVASHRPGVKDIFTGKSVTPPNLELHPPRFEEYPTEWQPLLEIGSEKVGIAALSAGADEFARASQASIDAVEAALDDLDDQDPQV